MRRIFKNQYLVMLLAFVALTWTLTFISPPRIKTSIPAFYGETALVLGFFFSLLVTKRIIFSLLFAILFIFQFKTLFRLFPEVVEFPMNNFINIPIFAPLFAACLLVLSYWQACVVYRFCQGIVSAVKKSEL